MTSKNKGIISHLYYMFLVKQLWLCSMFSLWQSSQIIVLHLRSSYCLGRGEKERTEPRVSSSKLLLLDGMSFLSTFYQPKQIMQLSLMSMRRENIIPPKEGVPQIRGQKLTLKGWELYKHLKNYYSLIPWNGG